MPIKMTDEELIRFLVENRKTENGDLDLANLHLEKDFHDVYIGGLTVEGSLGQDHQTVGGSLHQNRQTVGECLYQNSQNVKGGMILQIHDGLEQSKDGYWHKIKSLAEKVAESNLDEDLKKEILANLKGEGK